MPNLVVASWNVNSLKARYGHVLNWLESTSPDILCMQETKLSDESFSSYSDSFRRLGYNCYHNGIGQYNGVAILSKIKPIKVRIGFSSGEANIGVDYPECRLLVAYFETFVLYNVYVPNGRSLDDIHMDFKLEWLSKLRLELQSEMVSSPDKAVVVCGDFNIAPTDDDVKNIKEMIGSTHVSSKERNALIEIEKLGFIDIGLEYMKQNSVDSKNRFTWWDYRQLAFQKNDGMRIDLFLLWMANLKSDDQMVAKLISGYRHYRQERKKPKPSDHIPISIDLSV